MPKTATMREHAKRVLDHQQNQLPKAVAPTQAPVGQKLSGNLGPGTLYPGIGDWVQQHRQPRRCGTISGHCFAYVEHPNVKDPKRISRRFVGRFLLVNHEGKLITGAECYLPGTVDRTVKAALDLRCGQGDPVPISIEVWCEPDEAGRPRSPLGYSYVSYDRTDQSADPVLALAIATGILEPLPTLLSGPAAPEPDEADPETGEIRPPDASKAA